MANRIKISIILFLLSACLFQNTAMGQESLTWQDCIGEAAQNHSDLISAQEKINQSQAAKKITSSTLFPQVASDLSVSRYAPAIDK